MEHQQEKREFIEWSNTWYEDAANCNCKRFLLVGDSVARQYRSTISRCFNNQQIAVDFFGTSSVFFNGSLFWKQLENFLGEYKYDVAFVHIGGHHGYDKELIENNDFQTIYKAGFKKLIEYLNHFSKNIVIVSATPVMLKCKKKYNKPDEDFCKQVILRNKLMAQTAREANLTFIDLYSFIFEHKFKFIDNKHFESAGNIFVAQKIIKETIKQKKIDNDILEIFKKAGTNTKLYTRKNDIIAVLNYLKTLMANFKI